MVWKSFSYALVIFFTIFFFINLAASAEMEIAPGSLVFINAFCDADPDNSTKPVSDYLSIKQTFIDEDKAAYDKLMGDPNINCSDPMLFDHTRFIGKAMDRYEVFRRGNGECLNTWRFKPLVIGAPPIIFAWATCPVSSPLI